MRAFPLWLLVVALSCSQKDDPAPPPELPAIASVTPMNGNVGTEVIISGTNFSATAPGNVVKFNGTTATISQATGTQITTSVPAGASTGKISVTTNNHTATSAENFTVVAGLWTQKADFGGQARTRATGFSIGNKGYILTGVSSNTTPSVRGNDFWQYDQLANQWTRKADFPGPARENAVAFSIGGKGYITTGYVSVGTYGSDLWEYDPPTDQWTRKADFPGHPRELAVAFTAGSKGYIGLGIDFYTSSNTLILKDLWEYNPQTNLWSQKADFPGGNRWYATGFGLGDMGYVGMGSNSTQYNQLFKDLWEYNPQTNQWSQKADFAGGERGGAIAFSIAGKGYMGLGGSFSQSQKDFWQYDPQTNQWTRMVDFPGTLRGDMPAFTISNKGYIGTGSKATNPSNLNDYWEFDPR